MMIFQTLCVENFAREEGTGTGTSTLSFSRLCLGEDKFPWLQPNRVELNLYDGWKHVESSLESFESWGVLG